MITHRWLDPQQPARVVILGATGFVGRDVARHVSAMGIETVTLPAVTSAAVTETSTVAAATVVIPLRSPVMIRSMESAPSVT